MGGDFWLGAHGKHSFTAIGYNISSCCCVPMMKILKGPFLECFTFCANVFIFTTLLLKDKRSFLLWVWFSLEGCSHVQGNMTWRALKSIFHVSILKLGREIWCWYSGVDHIYIGPRMSRLERKPSSNINEYLMEGEGERERDSLIWLGLSKIKIQICLDLGRW